MIASTIMRKGTVSETMTESTGRTTSVGIMWK